nr:hypothetical protein [Tanacetum cinerariifolium]
MVNTRTDAELAAAVQNALQILLPQIRAEIREEFRTGSGPSGSGGNPPSVTIHTWIERFNKQMPRSFEKATAPVDAKNWISHMKKIFDVMGCEDAFNTRLAVPQDYNTSSAVPCLFIHILCYSLSLYPFTERYAQPYFFSCLIRQMVNTRTNAELVAAIQNALQTLLPQIRKEFRIGSGPSGSGGNPPPAKNFQWGLHKSTLNHLMCIPFTDVAQVANAARNYEILHERDDDDTERPDKRQKSGDRHQPTTQQSSHRNHGYNNDRHGSNRRGGDDNHRSNKNYSGNNNSSYFMHVVLIRGVDVHSDFLVCYSNLLRLYAFLNML